MNPLTKLTKIFNWNKGDNYIGAPSFRHHNPAYSFLDCYESDRYASVYPSIKAISNEFMKIRPFAVDANGKPVKNAAALNALYHPNQADSSVAFFEKLAVMALTHRKTYLLVWRNEAGEAKPGGNFGFKGNNIAGFTFLENPAVSRRDGRTYYGVGSQEFSDKEVIVISGGVDPYDLYGGYAPGEASRRWATLDEYIADFQQGFFENGAVPAGQFIITASGKTDYEDTVAKMQSSHRGAGKNNNVTYTPRPVDPATGKPADAKVEWIPFAQSNKDIDFKSLFDQANKRIDSTFGVPASIRGVGENNNYATARLDQQNFIRFTVEPLAVRIYTQITHELNRITGGLGVSITFELEYPAIADEEKVEAETKQVEANIITQMTANGQFTLDSVVDAFDLSTRYKLLKSGSSTTTSIDNDKPDVDDGNEVEKSPDPSKIDGVTPLNVKAELNDTEKESYEVLLAGVIRDNMKKQIDQAVNAVESVSDAVEEDVEVFTDEMLQTVVASMVASGYIEYEQGIMLLIEAGVSVEGTSSYVLSDVDRDAYRKYLKNVAMSYSEETAASIRNVLDRANIEGLTKAETQAALRNVMNTDEYRVTRLAVSEINRSQQMGSLQAMQQIESDTESTIYKVWNVSNTERCEFCLAMDGKQVGLSKPFVAKGETIQGVNGGVYVNDFVDMDTPQAHPNCMCYFTWEVQR